GSNITITNSTVTATSTQQSAGIGGGYAGAGNVTINSGTVTATSGSNGAGIGGGLSSTGTVVTINGGTVKATGGSNGAGIGGGSASGATVTITGGYITASGYTAIGSGSGGSDSTISITGGYFGSGTAGVGTEGYAYTVPLTEGYTAYTNLDSSTSGSYPIRVLSNDWTASVTYAKPDGVSGDQPTDNTGYSYGNTVTVKTEYPYTYTGYKQVGWSLTKIDEASDSYTQPTTFTITDDTTLYPVFARAFTDSGTSTDISLTYGETYSDETAIDLDDYLKFVDDENFDSTDGEFTYTELSGTLPSGMEFDSNSGTITGTPTAASSEATEVKFTVTDNTPYISLSSLENTTSAVTATLTLTFTVAEASPTYTAPTADTLYYTGEAQALVTAGTAENGTMYYSLTGEDDDWSTSVPTGTDAKTYTVYYKVVGDTNYSDIEAQTLTVTIAQSGASSGGIKTYSGDTEASEFNCGDTITVKATISASGTAASANTLSLLDFASLTEGYAAVFNGDTQVSEPVKVTSGTEFELTVDTETLGEGEHTLTLKYYGDDNMAAMSEEFTVTVNNASPFTVTDENGNKAGTYANNTLTISESGTYTITMADDTENTTDTIVVNVESGEEVTIYLDGVSITSDSTPAIEVTGGGSVTLILVGENTLTATDESTSGVTVTSGSTLTITGTGGLTADAISGETDTTITVTGGSYSDSAVVADYIATNYSSHTDSTSETYDCVVVSDSQQLVVTGGVEYTYEDGVLTITGGGDYTISMNEYADVTSASDTIVIDSDEDVTVTLDDVTIESGTSSPLTVSGDGDVTVVISGDVTLTATGDDAAITSTSTDGTLTITSETSTDTLTATGGTDADAVSGDSDNISIDCGTYSSDVSAYVADNYYSADSSGSYTITRSASTVYDTTEAVNFSVTLDGLYDNLNSAGKIDHSEAAEYRVVLENLDTEDGSVTKTVFDSIKNALTSGQSVMAVDISVKKYVGGVEDETFDYNSILENSGATQTVQITLPAKASEATVYHIPDSATETSAENYKVNDAKLSDDGTYVTFSLSSFSGTIIPYNPISLTSGSYAESVYLTLESGSDAGEYTLKLCGTDGYDIQNLTAAQFKFALDDTCDINKISALSIDAAYGVSMTYLGNGEYSFTVDGGVTATSITLGTVKIVGEGTYSLGLNTTSGFANQATVNSVVFPYNATQDTGKLYLYGFPVTGTASLTKSNLTVNVMFPNEIGSKTTEYTAMNVAYSNALGDYSVALGSDNTGVSYTEINTTNGWYGYTFTVQVPMSYTTSLTFSGDGYRTYDATITPTGANSSVTVWNSILDDETTVVSADNTAKTTVDTITFLAGDIVGDGIINLYDLSAATSYFGASVTDTTYIKYDLNRDGKIDSRDLAMVLVSWGK
ncbi:MAG: carbohydrate-binding domain-containing protein, partial [Firmicutes bacterium]|nr:carbohydrate-binding domain-containing protein [Bacillota bacterium]